jgi:hypothetical protein
MDKWRINCYIHILVFLLLVLHSYCANAQAEFHQFVTPGDPDKSIQYNHGGTLTGASAVSIFDSTLTLHNENSSLTPTEGNGMKIFKKTLAGREFFCAKSSLEGHEAQPFIANKFVSYAQAVGTGQTTTSLISFTSSSGGASTSGRGITPSNKFNQRKRLGHNSSAATNSSAYFSNGLKSLYRSSGAGLGGFFVCISWGISDATFQDSSRVLVGLTAALPSASGEPSAHTNQIVVAADALDTMLYLMHNDFTGTSTKILLGNDFRKMDSNTNWFRTYFYNPQGSGTVYYLVRNEISGVEVSGSITTDLPSTSSLLGTIAWRNTGLQNQAVSIDWAIMYEEMNY